LVNATNSGDQFESVEKSGKSHEIPNRISVSFLLQWLDYYLKKSPSSGKWMSLTEMINSISL